MKNIVLAYDGSEPAKRALERTAELANGAAVTVISAVHILPAMGRAGAAIDEGEVTERKQELEDAAEYLRGKGIEPETVEARGVDVGDAILEEARETDADLIVVGSSGKNLAERIVLGSVSSKVVHESPCDVLVVR
jgi:nucleotide-binding universal stress UspA family protein